LLVPKDDKKAAEAGNTEGVYSLEMDYARGVGVGQDLPRAYQLYLQAANMSAFLYPHHPRPSHIKNLGAAEAQHSLGLFSIKELLWSKTSLRLQCGTKKQLKMVPFHHHPQHHFYFCKLVNADQKRFIISSRQPTI